MSRAIIFTFFSLVFCASVYAQSNIEAEFSGYNYKLNQKEQYMRINISDLNIPLISDKNFIEYIFSNKTDYILCTIQIYTSDNTQEKVTIVPFSLEKVSSSKYRFESFNPGTEYVAVNALKFPYAGTLKIDIEFKVWEGDENKSLVKKIFNAANTLEVIDPGVLPFVEVGLNLIDEIVPPTNTTDIIHDNLSLNEITKEELKVVTMFENQKKSLMTIKFGKVPSHFDQCNFEATNDFSFLTDSSSWKIAIGEAAVESRKAGDQNAIRSVLVAFSEYINSKPLVEKDKALFAAGALHEWAPLSINECIGGGCISSGLYQEMTVGNLKYIRDTSNGKWDFKGVNCSGESCIAMSDFLRKSRVSKTREQGKKYIEESFELYVNGSYAGDISESSYVENFAISNVTPFDTKQEGDILFYKLQKGTVIKYRASKDKEFTVYEGYDITLRQIFHNGNHYVTSIHLTKKDS